MKKSLQIQPFMSVAAAKVDPALLLMAPLLQGASLVPCSDASLQQMPSPPPPFAAVFLYVLLGDAQREAGRGVFL